MKSSSPSTNFLKSDNKNNCPMSTLCDVSVNLPVRIRALHGEPAVCQRLREMGFCEFAEVRKVSQGSALLCHVCGVKVALSRYLAKNILVETIHSSSNPKSFPGETLSSS